MLRKIGRARRVGVKLDQGLLGWVAGTYPDLENGEEMAVVDA
jgi:hypothetical protein